MHVGVRLFCCRLLFCEQWLSPEPDGTLERECLVDCSFAECVAGQLRLWARLFFRLELLGGGIFSDCERRPGPNAAVERSFMVPVRLDQWGRGEYATD
jgi:hypothetical protein